MSVKFIEGKPRNQTHLFPISVDASIDENNEIRLIDLFVDGLDLKDFGFRVLFGDNGRPAYHPQDLLKLYIYGYLNRIRSSRQLEKACSINIEVMWLMKCLRPDHNTISNFRKDNPKAIKKVFRATVKIAQHFELIGGKLIAGDSTKLRAQNSKKNNFNQKKVDRHIDYIENKLEQYNQELQQADGSRKEQIEKAIIKQQERKQVYHQIEHQLNETGESQVSTADPESRQMTLRNNITEVAYNIQTTVDEEHNIPIDYKVTNQNDSKAMGNMVRRAKTILRNNEFTALFDKGYHTGSEFETANNMDIDVLVAIPKSAANAPNTNYNVAHFKYLKKEDLYICPQGQKLTTSGKKHQAKTFTFKRYITKACKNCPVKDQCSKAKYGKAIQRSQYQGLIQNNKNRIEKNKEYYKKRQAIVEHPYGTIKRQWGFSYILTKKGMKRASADVGFMFTAYNLRRLINIIGVKALQKYLKEVIAFLISNFYTCTSIFGSFKASTFKSVFVLFYYKSTVNRLYLSLK